MEAAANLVPLSARLKTKSLKKAYASALEEYKAAMHYSLDFAFAGHNLGNMYRSMGNVREAEAHYLRAIRIDDAFLPAKINLAMLYNEEGNNPAAEKLFREVVEANPEFHEASYSLGLLLAENKDYEGAAVYLTRAAEGMPERPRVHYNLGLLLQYLNRTQEAEDALKRAVRLEPDNLDFLYALADFFIKQERWDEAECVAEQMVEKHPDVKIGHEILNYIHSITDLKVGIMLQIFRDWTKRYFSDPQMIILGLMLILGFAIVFLLGKILMPVFASVVIAYLLEGMVGYLQRWKVPRMVAVVIVFLSFIAGMFVLIIWLFPLLSRQISQLIQQLPTMLLDGQKQLMLLPEKYPDFISEVQIQQIFEAIKFRDDIPGKTPAFPFPGIGHGDLYPGRLPYSGAVSRLFFPEGQRSDPGVGQSAFAGQPRSDHHGLVRGEQADCQLHPRKRLGNSDYLGHKLYGFQTDGHAVQPVAFIFRGAVRYFALHRCDGDVSAGGVDCLFPMGLGGGYGLCPDCLYGHPAF